MSELTYMDCWNFVAPLIPVSLTERQRQILRYRVAGTKIKEIAETLGYSHTLIENEINTARRAAKRYL